jgi:hypothetical protein
MINAIDEMSLLGTIPVEDPSGGGMEEFPSTSTDEGESSALVMVAIIEEAHK